jgi:hypothetical protein
MWWWLQHKIVMLLYMGYYGSCSQVCQAPEWKSIKFSLQQQMHHHFGSSISGCNNFSNHCTQFFVFVLLDASLGIDAHNQMMAKSISMEFDYA